MRGGVLFCSPEWLCLSQQVLGLQVEGTCPALMGFLAAMLPPTGCGPP